MPGLQDRHQLREAIESLDRATNDFTERLERIRDAVGPSEDRRSPFSAGATLRPESLLHEAEDAPPPPPPAAPTPSMHERLDVQATSIEEQASAYLREAKARADALVHSVMSAVEQEAQIMRRDAEQRIQERWAWVEFEAGRHVEEAKARADQMVVDREARISELSDTMTLLADSLTTKMEDADRIRQQFASFVHELSEVADRVVRDSQGVEPWIPPAPSAAAAVPPQPFEPPPPPPAEEITAQAPPPPAASGQTESPFGPDVSPGEGWPGLDPSHFIRSGDAG